MNQVRVGWWLLAAHVALVAFSTTAMLTVLAGNSPADVTSEPAATIMRVSFRLAGPLSVVLGTLAALAFLVSAAGWARAILAALLTSAIALGAELAGTSTGLPFGDYAYSGMLGYRIAGLVPFPIPLSWFYMILGSLVIVARLRIGDAHPRPWRWAFGAGLLMVAWDVSMDPAMVATGHWRWGTGAMFPGAPPLIEAFFIAGVFYGMPLSNWFGWLLTATIIARAMLAVVPPDVVRTRRSRSNLPVVLYLANGVMPVALCLREGFWWAAALGSSSMLVPACVALRRGRAKFSLARAGDPATTPRDSQGSPA